MASLFWVLPLLKKCNCFLHSFIDEFIISIIYSKGGDNMAIENLDRIAAFQNRWEASLEKNPEAIRKLDKIIETTREKVAAQLEEQIQNTQAITVKEHRGNPRSAFRGKGAFTALTRIIGDDTIQ